MKNLQNKFYKTYKDIYHHRYQFDKNEKKDALFLIKKNLQESKIKEREFKKLKVLNVGTGRESYAFLELKVNNCQLVDLSPKTKIKASYFKKIYKNFNYQIKDFCSSDLKLNEFNFLYLNGVFHHFHSPEKSLKNINKFSKINSKYFFRIYRSGSIKFYIVDFIRKFISIKDQKKFQKIFIKKFNIKQLTVDLSHENPIIHFHEMCVDNFFVPNLFLFDLKNLIKTFDNLGLSMIYNDKFKDYDHSVNKKDNTGISICFEKTKEVKFLDKKKLKISSQIHDINYKEDYIKKTNKIFIKYLKKIKMLSDEKRINLAIDLLFICQSYRIFKFYNKKSNLKKTGNLFSLSTKYSSPRKIHLALQKRINLDFL